MAVLECQRHLFDVPDDISYFNCAYNSPLLNEAADAIVQGALSKRHPWQRKPAHFFEDAETFRAMAARALGGSPDCYAVIPSASYGTSMVARILEERLQGGDEIVVLDEAFPSNYLPWKRLSDETGAQMVVVPTPSDSDWTRAVLDRITPRTRLLALPNCHWTTGAALDLAVLSDAARSAGATLVLEVTQSLGAMPLDLARVRPDFVVAAGYKWLLCPYGLSLFYADPRWHDARPLEETWLSRSGAEVFEDLVKYSPAYQSGARRFEMGQKSVPSVLPGGVIALRQIGDWGVTNIAETLSALNETIAHALTAAGFTVVPRALRAPHILGATRPGGIPDSLVQTLASRNIFISRRGASLRFAPHLHVGDTDMQRLLEAIKASAA